MTTTRATVDAPAAASADVDPRRFRDVLGHYPTGVVIVTAIWEGEPIGMVVGSFASVSLDPPLVLFMPMKTSRTFARIREAESFCVNILAADQEDLCRSFSWSEPDRFAKAGWRPSRSGAPILDGVVGWIDCTLADLAEGGDHHIVIGRVTELDVERDCLPLLFFQSGYGRFAPGSLVASQSREFIESVRLAELARDDIELIAAELGVECSVLVPDGNDSVFVATANHSSNMARAHLGARVPITAPLGTIFVDAPAGPSEAAWLAHLGRARESEFAEATAKLARVRRRGWSLSLTGSVAREDLEEVVRSYTDSSHTVRQERDFYATVRAMSPFHEPESLDPDQFYDVLNVSIPVTRGDGTVVMGLRLGELPPHASGHDIESWLNALGQTAEAVAAKIAAHEQRQDRPD